MSAAYIKVFFRPDFFMEANNMNPDQTYLATFYCPGMSAIYVCCIYRSAYPGLQIRVRIEKLFSLFLIQKNMLWVLKRTISMRRFF